MQKQLLPMDAQQKKENVDYKGKTLRRNIKRTEMHVWVLVYWFVCEDVIKGMNVWHESWLIEIDVHWMTGYIEKSNKWAWRGGCYDGG